MKYLERENGITLISLVVTTIVLIILAGVSINMLTGQNRNINTCSRGKRKNRTSKGRRTIYTKSIRKRTFKLCR